MQQEREQGDVILLLALLLIEEVMDIAGECYRASLASIEHAPDLLEEAG